MFVMHIDRVLICIDTDSGHLLIDIFATTTLLLLLIIIVTAATLSVILMQKKVSALDKSQAQF